MASNSYAQLLANLAPAKKGGGGIGGFVDHLAGDLRDSAVGLPTGIIHLAEHPIGSVEAMGKSTWHDWSPLFEGHLGKFGHQFYAHPLAPLLDVASVLTGGAGAAGKLASLGLDAGLVDEASAAGRLAKFSKSEPLTFTKDAKGMVRVNGKLKRADTKAPEWAKHTSANPLTKAVQLKINKLTTEIAPHLPGWFGETMSPAARYDRLETRMMAPRAAALRMQITTFMRAAKDMTGPDALKYRRQVLVHSFNQLLRMGKEADPSAPLAEGWKYVEAQPTKTAAHTAAHAEYNMHVGKLKGLRSNISKQHGVIVPNAQAAKQMLKDTTAQLDKAKAQFRPYNHLRTKQEMLQRYVETDKRMNAAAQALGRHQSAFNGARDKFFRPNDKTDIEGDMHGFSNRYTTMDVRRAHINANGKAIIVPKHTVDKFGFEGMNASKTLKLLYSKPVTAWKYLLLGTRPAYFVNNAVGNYFMYAMGHGGTAGVKGFVDAIAQTKGEAAAIRSMGRASRSLNPHWMDKNFRDQLNNTFSGTAGKGLGAKLNKYSMFPITHKVADQFVRRAAINAEMRRAPEVARLMKGGMTYDKAAERVLNSGDGQLVRDRISQKVMDTMGDYHSMNAGERLAASVMPFYTWNRHALRFTKAAFRDHPGRLDVAAKSGNQGTAETLKALGEIPSYLKGSIPLSMLGMKTGKDGRTPILSTSSLNPLATIPDLADFGRSIVGNPKGVKPGEAIGSQLNPILAGAIQHLSGTSLSTGAPIPSHKGGLVGDIAMSTLEGLPQGSLIKSLINGNPQPKPNKQTGKTTPFLFAKDKKQYLGSILGVPVKELDKTASSKQYNQENGIKKGRKNKYSDLLAALSG